MYKRQEDARFDGKWVLKTNTELSAEAVALKYKELWQVEHTFRDLKSTFETRPVFHQEMRRFEVMCFAASLHLFSEKCFNASSKKPGMAFPGRRSNRTSKPCN